MNGSELPLRGRTAVVTGGGQGIGEAITSALAGQGARTVVLSRHPGVPEPGAFRADITSWDQLEDARQRMAAQGLLPDTLVANAGSIVRGPALEMTDRDLRETIDTNLRGTFLTLQTFGAAMLTRPGARFVVIGSVVAIHGMNLRAAYTASKAGVSTLVRCLAVEWGPHQATINAVAPGIIRTPLTEGYIAEHPDRAAAVRANTPLGRFGEPGDIAGVVAFLISDRARFITGQTICVDGGITAGSSFW